jgi:hypothetical protein
MRKHGEPNELQDVTGYFMFTSLDLVNDTIVSLINGVVINHILFSSSDQLQDITGHKWIAGNITLIGQSTITNINGEDSKDFVRKSICRNKPHLTRLIKLPAV